MKAQVKISICIGIVLLFVLSATASSQDLQTATIKQINGNQTTNVDEDLDPLVDIIVTVEIQKIRSLEKNDRQLFSREKIDPFSDPDFYVKVFINDVEFESPIWRNTKYVYDPQWSATLNVPDDQENVSIKIQLWDWNIGIDTLCDISNDRYGVPKDLKDVELTYDIKTGHWYGDDFTADDALDADPSGYGRLNGCDDGTIYQRDHDCELWFNIYQNDKDNDNIPYWTEVNIYGTDPLVNNTGDDSDGDGVPIEWEHKWGVFYHRWWGTPIWMYDPFKWEDHKNIDLDQDGLDNYEEYLTSQWGSDPLRRDIFLEMDMMEDGPDGIHSEVPDGAKELLRTAYGRRNIVFNMDDGCMGGSDVVPFSEDLNQDDLHNIYWTYFLHEDENNWRRGVFRYAIIAYYSNPGGFVFWGGVGPYLDALLVSSKYFETEKIKPKTQHKRDIVYASAIMHETGHTLGIYHSNTPGCDDQEGKFPWQLHWWKWRPYISVMNYGYMYKMVDYSDGSRGRNDFDDWDNIDLTAFQRAMW